MHSLSQRLFLGAAAGALSMLLFHQTMLQVFFWLGLAPTPAFRLAVVPPFHVPQVVSACFWAALIGAGYAGVTRHRRRSTWAGGLSLGCLALALVWFVVLPLKGEPVGFGWQMLPLIRSVAASLAWGVGVSLLLPMLLPRRLSHGRAPWQGGQLTA